MGGRMAAVAALALFASSIAGAQSSSALLAAAHAAEALALHEAGRDDQALWEAETALSWDGASSDALFLMALLDDRPGPGGKGPWKVKAERLSTALSASNFSLMKESDAILMLARAYDRLACWDDCLDALSALKPDKDPEAWFLGMKAAFFLGRSDDYRRTLNAALDLWPADPRFARFWADQAGAGPWTTADQAIMDRLRGVMESLYQADPELLVSMARMTADARKRDTLLRRYRAQGGRSRRSIVEALRYGLEDEAALVGEFITGITEAAPLYASEIDAMLSILSGKGRTTFLQWLAGADLSIASDRNGDGVADALTVYRKAALHEWRADADQDGLDEAAISFADGAPSAAIFLGGPDGTARLNWRSYPEVESLAYETADGPASLFYGAAALALQPLSFSAPWKASSLAIRIAEPSSGFSLPSMESAILRANRLRKEETVAGRKRVREALLRDGMPLLEEMKEGPIVMERREFERGIPTLSRMDLDGDGRFDALMRYGDDGKPASFEADADGDGIVEYRELYGRVPRMEWDFTADGLMDAAQEKLSDGSVVRWFSSALDGNFDLVLTLRDERIVSVTRAGKPVAVRREPSGRVTWLGEMPFSLGADIPAQDGVHRRSGKLFHVYHGAGMVYAELVR